MRSARVLAVAAAVVALSVVAACGGGTGEVTVTARDLPGVGSTLVDVGGKTLYFADQEADGKIRCVASCLLSWVPLTVSAGTIPTGGTGVTGVLATVTRPDGSNQVTYDGRPLYTFTADGGPGKSGGNGAKDSFGGTDFVWHAAAVSGFASAPADNGGDNGFGY